MFVARRFEWNKPVAIGCCLPVSSELHCTLDDRTTVGRMQAVVRGRACNAGVSSRLVEAIYNADAIGEEGCE